MFTTVVEFAVVMGLVFGARGPANLLMGRVILAAAITRVPTRQDYPFRLRSSRRRNTPISLAVCLSPRASATAMPSR